MYIYLNDNFFQAPTYLVSVFEVGNNIGTFYVR